MGRSVQEILIGWDILAGHVRPYVLLTYLLSPLVGTISCPGERLFAEYLTD